MHNLDTFKVLNEVELSEVSGGVNWGWLGAAQPVYDFARGAWKGFYESL